jgi:homoserine O-succinyltransferase
MPIIIPSNIPAFKTLQDENVFIYSEERAANQDIRPIEIAVLNLMPTKIETETQLLRLLSNTPLQVNVTFIKTATYKSQNVTQEHLDQFYVEFESVKHRKFDGMIITGAPVETMQFDQVAYWDELKSIMNFAQTNVTSTIFICWGAQAGMYHFFGVPKILLNQKISGVYEHVKVAKNEPLLKGVDDILYIPHSRYTMLDEDAIAKCDKVQVLAYSDHAKSSIIKSKDNKFFFLTGHSEYDCDTLDKEYTRDRAKGMDIAEPCNYYINGKVTNKWRSTANLIFSNWLNYYVYQITPYRL